MKLVSTCSSLLIIKFDATFLMNVCLCSKDLSAPASVANVRRFVRSSPKNCISLKVDRNSLAYLIIGAIFTKKMNKHIRW